MDRAVVSETKGRQFKSAQGHRKEVFRGVAQLVECCVRDAEVVGSSPATPTPEAIMAGSIVAFFRFSLSGLMLSMSQLPRVYQSSCYP